MKTLLDIQETLKGVDNFKERVYWSAFSTYKKCKLSAVACQSSLISPTSETSEIRDSTMAICGITIQAFYEAIINGKHQDLFPKEITKKSKEYQDIYNIFLGSMKHANTSDPLEYEQVLGTGRRAKLKSHPKFIEYISNTKDTLSDNKLDRFIEEFYRNMSYQFYLEEEFVSRLVSLEGVAKQLTNAFIKSWKNFYIPIFKSFDQRYIIKSEVYTKSKIEEFTISGGIDFIVTDKETGKFSLYDGKWNVSNYTDREQLPFYATSLILTEGNGFNDCGELAFLDWRAGKIHHTTIPKDYNIYLKDGLNRFRNSVNALSQHLNDRNFRWSVGDKGAPLSVAEESFPYMKVGVNPSKTNCRFCNIGGGCNRSLQSISSDSFAKDNREAIALAGGSKKTVEVEL